MRDSLVPYTFEDVPKLKTVVCFDSRGLEPTEFDPRVCGGNGEKWWFMVDEWWMGGGCVVDGWWMCGGWVVDGWWMCGGWVVDGWWMGGEWVMNGWWMGGG